MADVLIVSDQPWVADEVKSVLSTSDTVREARDGRQALAAVVARTPDLAVLDMQIATMGGIAICLELRLEESGGRLPHVPVLLLLDRRPDVFLARRAEAEGWVLKPLDPIRLRRAVESVLAGGDFEDDARVPVPVLAGAAGEADIQPQDAESDSPELDEAEAAGEVATEVAVAAVHDGADGDG